ncbi:Rv3235 family protein [Rhodococcus sovatensis]|uniref:Rv3235 family protein n=1 Tax=Rhodococcus sovatensis TaxID=1805840 RepID=A0ABZ2PTT5_9NOCA
MDTGNEPVRHAFLARAPSFEPPIDSDCAHRARACGPANRSTPPGGLDRRSRPFPRSVGLHPGSDTHTLDSHTPHNHPDTSRHRPTGGNGDSSEQFPLADARRGAEQAFRLLLEVLDRRRPAEHMDKLFTPGVVESVKTIVRTRPPGLRLGTASLRQVHVSRAAPNAAEVFATYNRGQRVFAVAARLELRTAARQTAARRTTWTVTSLRVV